MSKIDFTDSRTQIMVLGGAFSFFIISLCVYMFFFSDRERIRTYTVRVGNSLVLNMKGKSSVEFRWQLNKRRSSKIDILNVDHIGWTYPEQQKKKTGTGLFGVNRISRFSIEAKSPGVSYLTFEYKRRGIEEDTPIKTKKFIIKAIN